ncbi:farnesol dehydrogenase-like [Glossina fuscipes fuscipes]
MERWLNKVAVVTGASSGIGAATAKDLVHAGLNVVGLARRVDRVEELKQQLPADKRQYLTAIKCDVADVESVNEAFKQIVTKFGGIDVLVNNAGRIVGGQLCTMDVAEVQRTLQTNVMGVIHCTQHAFKSMKERNMNGHIFIINSIAGHNVVSGIYGEIPMTNVYSPSKYALTAITEIYRREFLGLETKIKITSISLALVETELVGEHVKRLAKDRILSPHDISNAIMYALSTPPHVQIHDMIIKPLGDLF